MLYGQNLPWRAALRHATRTGANLPRRLSTARTVPLSLSSQRLLITAPRSCSAPLSRAFSYTSVRRKDEPPKPASELGLPSETSEESKEQKDRPDSLETKGKVPEPIPQGKSADGRGASASGGSGESGSSGGDGGGRKKRSSERSLSKPAIPEVYPQVMAIPIAKRPLFPGFYRAITIRDKHVAAAIHEMIQRGQPYIGAFLLKDENADKDTIESMDEVYDVGTFCQITSAFPVKGEETSMTAVMYPHRRIKLTDLVKGVTSTSDGAKVEGAVAQATVTEESPTEDKSSTEKRGDVVASFEEGVQEQQAKQVQHYEPTSFLKKLPVSLVSVENMVEEPHDKKNPTINALVSEIVSTFKEVATLSPLFRDHISTFSMSQNAGNVGEDPAKLADFAAAVAQAEPHELQEALSSMDVEDRLNKSLILLKKELMTANLQSKIAKDVETKIQKKQREYWLMEQMKGIKRELGLESDGKDKLVEKFKEKASKLAMPEAVKRVFEEEINKLGHLEPAASEFNVTRNYLDWLTQIPWGQRSAENFGIKHAMEVLEEDHHGLKDVKDRILEFIAVGKLRGTVEGKILCMVGPPGVGKTSIGTSLRVVSKLDHVDADDT
jgi:ATP-dependent Lon protease